MALNNVKLTII